MAGHGGRSQEGSLDDPDVVEQGSFVDINIVPLVDIMMVLLVILMASSTAILDPGGQGEGAGFRVNLPSASDTEEVSTLNDQLVVAVLEDGVVIARGNEVSIDELDAIFQEEVAKDKDQLVLVQADEQAIHRRVVQVMETARKAGLQNLAIATKPDN